MKRPQPKDYQTNDGMHAAVRAWAATKARGDLRAVVTFADGSEGEFDSPAAQLRAWYRTPDGELYWQDYDGSRVVNDFMPGAGAMLPSEFKRAFAEWLGEPCKSIRWTRVK